MGRWCGAPPRAAAGNTLHMKAALSQPSRKDGRSVLCCRASSFWMEWCVSLPPLLSPGHMPVGTSPGQSGCWEKPRLLPTPQEIRTLLKN